MITYMAVMLTRICSIPSDPYPFATHTCIFNDFVKGPLHANHLKINQSRENFAMTFAIVTNTKFYAVLTQGIGLVPRENNRVP